MIRRVHASGPVTSPTTSTPPAAGGPLPADTSAPDWADEAMDKLDEVVRSIRSNTTDRLVKIARIVVLGVLVAIFGITAGVLALIALVRGLDVAIPGPVWEVYLLLGAIFTGAGLFVWSKKGRGAN